MKTAISTNTGISLNPGNYARYGHFTTENERNSSIYPMILSDPIKVTKLTTFFNVQDGAVQCTCTTADQ